jgi:peptidoglycan/xylan/chitin deacetylase (PgdA/CDA1 family)
MNRRLEAVAAALLVAPILAWAQAPAAAASAPGLAASTAHAHSGPEHTARIRSAHYSRLQERLDATPGQLREQCRFESEAGTLPPPGVVALTFDDGPEPGQTEHIVEVLTRLKVPATFFVIAEKAERHAELLGLMRSLPGARLGSHSWSHPNFHQLDADAQRREIDRADTVLAPVLRPETPPERLFRYPYGNSSCEGNEHLHAKGYRIVGWHVDSCDWAFDGDGAVNAHEALSCGVLSAYRRDFVGHVLASVRAHRGGIVLMHETHHHTVQQLETLVKQLQAEGFSFGTPDEPAWAGVLR